MKWALTFRNDPFPFLLGDEQLILRGEGGGWHLLKINILAVKHLKINILAWVTRKINK